ncbi:coiled-coil domain containing 2 [Planoprotostelium fungivorum]|uniref:Coiled-coil domain containing 2 n=1 Tax=Planoprotostelium fungivorum TaxID=1890364 RepID=A0A2P6NM06_9EUKA|nr:coiled-coil domain containing 2 [Planoprotostelium fungivorum]
MSLQLDGCLTPLSAERPPSARPGSAARNGPSGAPSPSQGGARPPSGRPQSGMRPGSAAGRPGTGAQRPGSAMRPGTNGMNLGNVGNRNVLSQGLGRTATKTGMARTVTDRNYYVGELRVRIGELNGEIEKMSSEIEQFERDNQSAIQLQKSIDDVTEEVEALQGQLKDYNLLLDRLHTSTSSELEVEQLREQANDLKKSNEVERRKADQIFTERNAKENQIAEIEEQVHHIQQDMERQLGELNQSDRENYGHLKAENSRLITDIAEYQAGIDQVAEEIKKLQNELRLDPSKQKNLTLHDELRQLQKQKAELEEETSNKLSIPEEIEKLTHKVKATNAEVQTIESNISTVLEALNKLREDISNVEKNMAESKSERAEKFRDLVKKDKDMTEFMEQYESERSQLMEENAKVEYLIQTALETASKYVGAEHSLPSADMVNQMREDATFKEDQLTSSQQTAERLKHELDQRRSELDKMANLDGKIEEEMQGLKAKIAKMKEELVNFNSIDTVKESFENNKKLQNQEKQVLSKRKELIGQQNQVLSANNDAKERLLRENESHGQIEILEKSLRHYEQNNFHIKEYILAKGKEGDYKTIRDEVIKLTSDMNVQVNAGFSRMKL